MVESLEGTWAVAILEGTRAVLGKVDASFPPNYEELTSRGVIRFMEAYDFFSPLQQLPDGRGQPTLGRMPLIMGFEFLVHPAPVYVRWAALYFVSEMHEEDRRDYNKFIEGARKQSVAQRAQRAGLLTPAKGPQGLSIR